MRAMPLLRPPALLLLLPLLLRPSSQQPVTTGPAGNFATLEEVKEACPDESAACEADAECAEALAVSFSDVAQTLPETPPDLLLPVIQCFRGGSSDVSEARRKTNSERNEESVQIAEDVKCQFCGLLVEDMWSMTVQHVVMSKERDNVGRESREWLEDLCRIPSPLLERFVGLFDFRKGALRWEAVRDVPWADDPEGAYTPSFGAVGDYEDA